MCFLHQVCAFVHVCSSLADIPKVVPPTGNSGEDKICAQKLGNFMYICIDKIQ